MKPCKYYLILLAIFVCVEGYSQNKKEKAAFIVSKLENISIPDDYLFCSSDSALQLWCGSTILTLEEVVIHSDSLQLSHFCHPNRFHQWQNMQQNINSLYAVIVAFNTLQSDSVCNYVGNNKADSGEIWERKEPFFSWINAVNYYDTQPRFNSFRCSMIRVEISKLQFSLEAFKAALPRRWKQY